MSRKVAPNTTIIDRDGDSVAVDLEGVALKKLDTFTSAENLVRTADNPMAPRIHAIGANVNIRRTMTPAKYQASVPYNIIKIAPSEILLNMKNNPTGASGTKICKSKKNDVQVVG